MDNRLNKDPLGAGVASRLRDVRIERGDKLLMFPRSGTDKRAGVTVEEAGAASRDFGVGFKGLCAGLGEIN